MVMYVVRKTLSWTLVVFLATNLTFFLASSFLDPRSNYQGRRPPLTPEQITSLLEPYNLNPETPILERWWTWLTNILLHWDWGKSPIGESVNEQISYRIWVSAQLLLLATILSIILGIAVGVYTASRQYKLGDRIWQALSIIALNTHIVVVSIVVVAIALKINDLAGTRIFFVTGASSPGVTGFGPKLIDYLQHLALPTISLLIISEAIRKHALRTSIIPVATSIAFSVPGIFTGAVMTERIFAWQGMGTYFIETINRNDINGAVAVAAFGAFMTAVGAIISDLVVVALDPRVRVS